ncbi:hypothetical protein RUM43_000366 [Polyplax serrata]|uniref:Uncharacterized protein n=1 Tax=Polyplax serrata TaxID=468196 RepID=A0AAN8SCF2_POLSC
MTRLEECHWWRGTRFWAREQRLVMDLGQSLPERVNPSPTSEVGSNSVIQGSNTTASSEEEKWKKLFET